MVSGKRSLLTTNSEETMNCTEQLFTCAHEAEHVLQVNPTHTRTHMSSHTHPHELAHPAHMY